MIVQLGVREGGDLLVDVAQAALLRGCPKLADALGELLGELLTGREMRYSAPLALHIALPPETQAILRRALTLIESDADPNEVRALRHETPAGAAD